MGFFDRFRSPLTEDKFAQLLADALRRAGDDRNSTYDKAEFRLLHVKDGKQAGVTNLRNLYGEYGLAPPSQRAAWLKRNAVGLLHRMELPDDFEDVKPDLLPTIRPRSMIDATRLQAEQQDNEPLELAVLPLSEHLVVCLVYDLPTTMRFVTQKDLVKWGVSIYEAGEIARQNLEEKGVPMIATLDKKLYTFLVGDAFDATRMLLVDRIRALELSGDPLAMPINRDCLLITAADDGEGLGLMLDMAERQQDTPRPVCPIAHRLVGDEWQAWMPASDSPHFERFRRLGLGYFFSEYGDQKKLLEQWAERAGTEVFVASFSAVERGSLVLTYCVLSETVPTWLPKTDYVAFVSAGGENRGLVPWERVQATFGGSLEPLDYYPPRWSVTGFPTPAQLAEMQPENWSK